MLTLMTSSWHISWQGKLYRRLSIELLEGKSQRYRISVVGRRHYLILSTCTDIENGQTSP